jgi:hypothetical protein
MLVLPSVMSLMMLPRGMFQYLGRKAERLLVQLGARDSIVLLRLLSQGCYRGMGHEHQSIISMPIALAAKGVNEAQQYTDKNVRSRSARQSNQTLTL